MCKGLASGEQGWGGGGGREEVDAQGASSNPQGRAGIWAPEKEPHVAQTWGTMGPPGTCPVTRVPAPHRVAGGRKTAWSPGVTLGESSRWQGLVSSQSAITGGTCQLSSPVPGPKQILSGPESSAAWAGPQRPGTLPEWPWSQDWHFREDSRTGG